MRRYGIQFSVVIVWLIGTVTAELDNLHDDVPNIHDTLRDDVVVSTDIMHALQRMDKHYRVMEKRLDAMEIDLNKQKEVNVKLTVKVAELQDQLLLRKQNITCNQCMKTSPSSSKLKIAHLRKLGLKPKQSIVTKQSKWMRGDQWSIIQDLILASKKQGERIVAIESAYSQQTELQGTKQAKRQGAVNANARIDQKDTRRLERATAGSIAFTAYLDQSHINLGVNQVIQMRGIVLNEGNGYNQNTGIFTSPLAGVYMFSYTIDDYHPRQLRVHLLVDGFLKVSAVTNPPSINVPHQGGNLALLRLNAGQSVWLSVGESGDNIYGDNNRRYSTFSGVFLHA